jgi:uncharacterized protein with FMN-binding domain
MRRIVLWLMSTLTVLVLLFGYHTSTSSGATGAGGDSSLASSIGSGAPANGATPDDSEDAGPAATPTAPRAGRPDAGGSSARTTVTGDAAATRYGPVRVQLTVQKQKVTDVSVIEYPNRNDHDQEVNARALPILVSATLRAQSAKIDMVSGATYTSTGYRTSLQSALDKAGL